MPSPRIPESTWQALRIAVTSGGLTMAIASDRFGIPLGTLKARSARQRWFNHEPRNTEVQRAQVILDQRAKEVASQGITDATDATKGATDAQPVLKQAVLTPLMQNQDKKVVTARGVADGVAEEIAGNRDRFRKGMSRALAKAGERIGEMDADEVIALPDTVQKLARAGQSVFGDGQAESQGGLVINIGFLREPDPFDEVKDVAI